MSLPATLVSGGDFFLCLRLRLRLRLYLVSLYPTLTNFPAFKPLPRMLYSRFGRLASPLMKQRS